MIVDPKGPRTAAATGGIRAYIKDRLWLAMKYSYASNSLLIMPVPECKGMKAIKARCLSTQISPANTHLHQSPKK